MAKNGTKLPSKSGVKISRCLWNVVIKNKYHYFAVLFVHRTRKFSSSERHVFIQAVFVYGIETADELRQGWETENCKMISNERYMGKTNSNVSSFSGNS